MSMIKALTVKLSQRKQAAIVALLTQPTVAEAARVAGIRPNTLSRWMKEPEFDAVWRAAKSLGLDQAIARLQKISGAAVSALLKVLFDSSSPAAQLRAAEIILRYAKAAQELERVEARLAELERAAAASNPEALRPSAGERSSPKGKGHGEKFSRRKEDAIAALLMQRSIEEAARAIDIAPATLYEWMTYAEFKKDWREAKCAAFGQTTMRLQQAAGQASAIVARVMAGQQTPPLTRARAASLALKYGFAAAEEDIEARLLALGFAVEVAQAVLQGERRPFDEIAKDLAKVAA
jgi:predicted site-specific integrase-resolvase